VVDIPKIAPFVIEHQLHRLICPHCHTTTCAELPAGVESGGFGPQLSALVGLLGGVYHLSHRKVRSLLYQVLGVELSTGAINAIRCRLSESLAMLVEEATEAIRREQVAHMDETGGPIGNADGHNPEGKRAHIKRDFTAIAERSGVSAQVGQRFLELEHRHRWREGQISRQELQTFTTPIRQALLLIFSSLT
jgi:hypothetical protein